MYNFYANKMTIGRILTPNIFDSIRSIMANQHTIYGESKQINKAFTLNCHNIYVKQLNQIVLCFSFCWIGKTEMKIPTNIHGLYCVFFCNSTVNKTTYC